MADWFYVAAGEPTGPFDELALKQRFDDGTLPRDTQVWQSGMADWVLASEVSTFSPTPPEPIQPASPGPIEYIITPVVPKKYTPGTSQPAPVQAATTAPAPSHLPTRVVPAAAAPVLPSKAVDLPTLFTSKKAQPFGAPSAPAEIEVVRPSVVTAIGPKMPAAPSTPAPPQLPATAPTLPPLPNTIGARSVTDVQPVADLPIPTSQKKPREKLLVPLWVKAAGALIACLVVYSWLPLPWHVAAVFELARGQKAEDRNDYPGAAAFYKASLADAPKSPVVLGRLGVVSIYLRDQDTVDSVRQQLSLCNPLDDSDIKKAYAEIQAAETPK